MDPNETMRRIINSDDYDDAADHWYAYREWRSGGGFDADPSLEAAALSRMDTLRTRKLRYVR